MSLSNAGNLQCNYDEMMVRYKQLLTYIKSAVTRNHSEKSINSILDYISTSKNVSIPPEGCLQTLTKRLPFIPDGPAPELLRDHTGRPARCQE